VGMMNSTAILIVIDRRTRKYTIEELPEKQIRKMNRVERIHDFMLKSDEDYIGHAWLYMMEGFAVYRIID
jgi:hypothetical protein